jgi:hypothetical protein
MKLDRKRGRTEKRDGGGVFSLSRFGLILHFLAILVSFRYEPRASPLAGREFQARWPSERTVRSPSFVAG